MFAKTAQAGTCLGIKATSVLMRSPVTTCRYNLQQTQVIITNFAFALTKFNDKTMYFKLKTIDCHLKGFEAGDEILIVRGTYVKKDDPASEG